MPRPAPDPFKLGQAIQYAQQPNKSLYTASRVFGISYSTLKKRAAQQRELQRRELEQRLLEQQDALQAAAAPSAPQHDESREETAATTQQRTPVANKMLSRRIATASTVRAKSSSMRASPRGRPPLSKATPKAQSTSARPSGALLPPLNIPKWVKENSHLLKPPINNYCVHSDPLTVMIVGGPNARTDYHINATPEFFYQHKGRMLLKIVENDDANNKHATKTFRDIYIDEGDIFLLPANTPHNPVRFADTVGLVIEQPRPEGALDKLRWYCQGCGEVVHEDAFACTDLGSQIKDAINAFGARAAELRKCAGCGQVCSVSPSEEAMEVMRTGPHGDVR